MQRPINRDTKARRPPPQGGEQHARGSLSTRSEVGNVTPPAGPGARELGRPWRPEFRRTLVLFVRTHGWEIAALRTPHPG
ncbi:hypothetical protein GCM10027072_52140 [Streptomyces bullii]